MLQIVQNHLIRGLNIIKKEYSTWNKFSNKKSVHAVFYFLTAAEKLFYCC